ncbi:MAG: thioredoxin [Bacteroidales bacterium]
MRKLIIPVLLFGMSTALGFSQSEKKKVDTQVQKSSKKTIELTKADFLSKVANYETSPNEWKYLGDRPVLIDFYASWCGPCKAIAPILEELANEYGDSIYIYKINTEKERELSSVFGIRSIPSLLFVPMDGKPQMAQGAMAKDDLKKAIDEVLLKKK